MTGRVVQKGGWVYPRTWPVWVGPGGDFYASQQDAASADTSSYFVQEEDGTSKIVLEEGTDFLLLEEST